MSSRMSWPNYPRRLLMRKSLDGRASYLDGSDPTDQQRTDIAMIGTKLNDQVIIKVPPAHGSAREDGTGAYGLGPAARQGHHTRADPKAAQC